MNEVFLVIYFPDDALDQSNFEGRDEIEDPLDEVLMQSGLGEVTGGGSGRNGVNIDVEINNEEDLLLALPLIKHTLRRLNSPNNTIIKRYKPSEITYSVYD